MHVARGRPVELLILQPTAFCNIDCRYCFLADRNNKTVMSDEVLFRSIDAVFDLPYQNAPFKIVFHLGEPLVAGIDFVERAIKHARLRFGPDVWAEFHIQTNAMLINDAWCDLFSKYEVRIGVSLDGPLELNDAYRVDRRQRGTFEQTIAGIRTLQKNNIGYQILSVVTAEYFDKARQIYNFFKSLNPQQICFNLEEIEGIHTSSDTLESGYADYKVFWADLCRVWLEDDSCERVSIREFGEVLSSIAEYKRLNDLPTNQMSDSLRIVTVKVDGSVLTFAPELISASPKVRSFVYGNIKNDSLVSIAQNSDLISDTEEIKRGVEACRATCEYFGVCGGGSPSNKFFENGSMSSTETKNCVYKKKLLYDAVLPEIELWMNKNYAATV